MSKKKGNFTYNIIPLLLFLVGIFTLITASAPAETGITGNLYYEQFLKPYWGQAAVYFGGYLILIGFCLGFLKSPFKKMIALTLILIPLLMITDQSYSFSVAFSKHNIGGNLRFNSLKYFGKYGTLLIEMALCLAGGFLLFPFSQVFKLIPKLKHVAQKKIIDSVKETPQEKIKLATEEIKNKNQRTSIDLNRRVNNYKKPTLPNPPKSKTKVVGGQCSQQEQIIKAFASYGAQLEIGKSTYGPFSERYELNPKHGVKRKEIERLVHDGDVSAALGIKNIKISDDSDAKLYLELPHKKKPPITFSALTESFLKSQKENDYMIPTLIGVDAEFNPISCDLAELPHLLIAGTTGSGKSVLVKSIITSIMSVSTPNDVKIILVDPKLVEFGIFSASPFLACDVITDVEKTSFMIEDLIDEMETRYARLKESGRYSLRTYNENIAEDKRLPSVVAIIDEFADLMMMKKSNISDNIVRIAQKGRAAGIHLILATQRPSVNVINGLIKANIPGRIALKVASDIDSRTIIDKIGAEKLTGNGHMIFASNGTIELQGAFIKDSEIEKIVKGG